MDPGTCRAVLTANGVGRTTAAGTTSAALYIDAAGTAAFLAASSAGSTGAVVTTSTALGSDGASVEANVDPPRSSGVPGGDRISTPPRREHHSYR